MSTPITQQQVMTINPARGLREFGIPTDPVGTFTGTSGIQFNNLLGATEILAGLPVALANSTGAVYLSAIHGGLGSDARNQAGKPAAGFNPNVPAFANPEVTGYFVPPSASAPSPTLNGYNNTEKIQRSAGDSSTGAGGTIWQGLAGRTRLNFQLWISNGGVNQRMMLELYRDLNSADKIAGRFGAGAGATDPRNAMLVASWMGVQSAINQKMPCLATSVPFDLPSACNLYLLFRCLSGSANNRVVGSIWLS